MSTFFRAVGKVSEAMQWVAGVTLCVMMAVTFADVIGRALGHPVVGAYEIISFLGAIVVGFAIPYTSKLNGHIYVDFLINRFKGKRRDVMNVTTRIMGMVLFFLMGFFFLSMARDLYNKGEVSTTLRLPFYPIAAGLGVCCFVEILILVSSVVRIYGGRHE